MNTTEWSSTSHKVSARYLSSDVPRSLVAEPEIEHRGFSIQVATSLQAIEKLRPVWKAWTHSLETDIDYYLHKVGSDPTFVKPYVMTVYEGGRAQAMLVGLVRRRRVSAVVSFVPIRGPESQVLEIIHGGRMGSPSSVVDRMLAAQLSDAIRHGGFDLLYFRRFPLDSGLFREVQQMPGLLIKGRMPHVSCYSVLPLSPLPEKGLRAFSGKIRRETRRKMSILQRAFPGRVRYQSFSHPGELHAGLRDAASVAAKTWQRYLGDISLDSPQTQESLNFGARRGWLRIFVLYVDDRPRAFLVGQLYNRTLYCQHAGYDQDFASFSVGSLLTAWALEKLAADGVEEVDLGEGSQEHNRRLGCRLYREGTVHVYSPSLRGFWLNMFVASTQMVRVVGRNVRSGLRLNGLKRSWSQFLIARMRSKHELENPVSETSQAA